MQQQQQLGPGLRLPTAAGGHARLWHHLGRARRRCPPTSAACLAQLKGAPPWCTTSTTPCSRSRVLAHAAAASQWFPSSVDAQGAPKQRYDAGTAAPSVELHLDKAASPLARLLAWWTLRSPSPDAAQEEAAEGGPARTKLLPLIGKIISLVAPERLMLLLATVFMVRVRGEAEMPRRAGKSSINARASGRGEQQQPVAVQQLPHHQPHVRGSQVLAAAAELAIPHFATSCIFAAAGQGATDAAFKGTLRLLTVRRTQPHGRPHLPAPPLILSIPVAPRAGHHHLLRRDERAARLLLLHPQQPHDHAPQASAQHKRGDPPCTCPRLHDREGTAPDVVRGSDLRPAGRCCLPTWSGATSPSLTAPTRAA